MNRDRDVMSIVFSGACLFMLFGWSVVVRIWPAVETHSEKGHRCQEHNSRQQKNL